MHVKCMHHASAMFGSRLDVVQSWYKHAHLNDYSSGQPVGSHDATGLPVCSVLAVYLAAHVCRCPLACTRPCLTLELSGRTASHTGEGVPDKVECLTC